MSQNTTSGTGEPIIVEKVTRWNKLNFGFSRLGVGVLSGVINGPLGIFYHDKLGLETNYVGLALIIFAVWNALNDPLFGILEDRTRTKLGRRIPYLRYGAPLFGLAFIFCWFPVFGDTQTGMFFNYLLCLFLLDTMFTLIFLVTYVMPSEMCITQSARTKMYSYSVYLGSIGVLISMMISLVFFTEGNSQLNDAFLPAMVVIGIVGAGLIFLASFNLFENKNALVDKPLGFIDSIKETFKNKAFIIYEINNFFFQIAWVTLTGLMTYFVRDVIGMRGGMAIVPLIVVMGVIFAITGPATLLVEKWGLKKMYMIALVVAIVSYILLFFISSNQILSLIGFVALAFGFAPLTLVYPPMLFDIMDDDELKTGIRRETTYAGMDALITKPSISIAQAVFLWIIDGFGFDNSKVELGIDQDTKVQLGIRIAYCLVPAVMLIICLIVIKFFPLTGPAWNAKKVEINALHIEKEERYVKQLIAEGKLDPTI